jgi:hypothetical protein
MRPIVKIRSFFGVVIEPQKNGAIFCIAFPYGKEHL